MEQKVFKTVEEIKNWWYTNEGSHYSFSGLLTYVERSICEYPVKPNKPTLSQKHSANMASEYAKELLVYENELLQSYQSELKK